MIDEKIIEVSGGFVEAYIKLSVYDQYSEINKLSKQEIYLLLALSVETHDIDNIIVKNNLNKFKYQLLQILEMSNEILNNTGLNTVEHKNKYLRELVKLTGDTYGLTNIKVFLRFNGKCLPNLPSFDEIREMRLAKLLNI